MKHVEVVCAIIVNSNKEVFCCKRGPGRALEGFFEFPGGKVEKDETLENSIVREIQEELKTVILPQKMIGKTYHEYSDIEKPFAITLYGYICKLIQGSLELTEHTESKWVGIDELEKVNFAPADVPFIEMIKKEIK